MVIRGKRSHSSVQVESELAISENFETEFYITGPRFNPNHLICSWSRHFHVHLKKWDCSYTWTAPCNWKKTKGNLTLWPVKDWLKLCFLYVLWSASHSTSCGPSVLSALLLCGATEPSMASGVFSWAGVF